MSIETRNVMVFKGTRTTDKQRACLQEAGFVHVTGLREYDSSAMECPIIGEKLRVEEYGKWGYHHGLVVIVTQGGEIWLGTCVEESAIDTDARFRNLCLNPNGKGAFVPCSNGTQLSTKALLQRIANPSHGLVYPE